MLDPPEFENGKDFLVRQKALNDAAIALAWCDARDYDRTLRALTDRALEFGGRHPKPSKLEVKEQP